MDKAAMYEQWMTTEKPDGRVTRDIIKGCDPEECAFAGFYHGWDAALTCAGVEVDTNDFGWAFIVGKWNGLQPEEKRLAVSLVAMMAERSSLLRFVNKTLPDGTQLVKDGGE